TRCRWCSTAWPPSGNWSDRSPRSRAGRGSPPPSSEPGTRPTSRSSSATRSNKGRPATRGRWSGAVGDPDAQRADRPEAKTPDLGERIAALVADDRQRRGESVDFSDGLCEELL